VAAQLFTQFAHAITLDLAEQHDAAVARSECTCDFLVELALTTPQEYLDRVR